MEGCRQRGLPSALPTVVYHPRGGHVDNAPPELPDAELEVDLFRVEEEIPVEPTDGREDGATSDQTRAGHPIDLGRPPGLLGRRDFPSIG